MTDKTNKPLSCFVTDKTVDETPIKFFSFGDAQMIRIPLCEEADAHFVLRAKRDEVHRQIQADLKEQSDKLNAFGRKSANSLAKLMKNTALAPLFKAYYPKDNEHGTLEGDGEFTYDIYADQAIELALLQNRFNKLLIQKAESSVRILRQMREEYERNGKLKV